MKIDPSIFKAYDIRGIYPVTLNEEIAYKIGKAYAYLIKPQNEVLVGEDVRIHSHKLKEALIKGLIETGVKVWDVGLISTDMLYFGVGYYKKAGGIQTTASHNPPEWHGFKMVRENSSPITFETGISQIRDFVLKDDKKPQKTKQERGNVERVDIWEDYCNFILSYIKEVKMKPMRIVVNPNFGLAGKIFEKIIKKGNLPIEIIPLNFEPDGRFPKGRPDPFVPENRGEFIKLVKDTKADLGIAWDADADRVFFATDGGIFVEPYYLNTILIKEILKEYPRGKIIFDIRYTWALIDTIKRFGGTPILSRVGHSYIKEAMRKYDAVFAAESSGHTYYKHFWYSDCGMIPVMQILKFLSTTNKKLSQAIKPVMKKYFISGEINSEVEDKEGKIKMIFEKYKDTKRSRLDGIAVEYKDWRFCVRPSNTEPLLRLTLEAKSQDLVEEKTRELLSLIRS